MLEKLTQEQKDAMPAYAQKWIEIGLSTEPADIERFTVAAKKCYEFADLEWHDNVILVSSPVVMAFAAPIAAVILAKFKGSAVRGAVYDIVNSAVNSAVGGAVYDIVNSAVDGAVSGTVKNRWTSYLGGNMWAGWHAWRLFFHDVCGLELPGDIWDRAEANAEIAKSVGWWWPHRDFIMVCDRPKEIHLERIGPDGWNSHRLHNDTGPAISWRDGWCIWEIHGVRVTEQIVMRPETLTVEQILNESNSEVRRVMIEQLGWNNFAEKAQLKLIDECRDPANGDNKLSLFELPSHVQDLQLEPSNLLLCVNGSDYRDGTRGKFGLMTPKEITSVIEAAAWTYGLGESEYRQLERRT